jgi:hypothetical protein
LRDLSGRNLIGSAGGVAVCVHQQQLAGDRTCGASTCECRRPVRRVSIPSL